MRFHNGSVPFKFRGNWVNVDPSTWGDRSRMMVTVGSGAGDEQQKMGSLQQIFAIQKEMVMTDPTQSMVTPKQMYSTLNDYINLNGLGDPEQYFLNPESQEGQMVAQQKGQEMQAQQQDDAGATAAVADAADGAGRTAEGRAGGTGQGAGHIAERSAQGADRCHEGTAPA